MNSDYNLHRQARANQPGRAMQKGDTRPRTVVGAKQMETKMKRSLASAISLFILSSVWAMQVKAHPLTLAECNEGGEFIRNAALARDNGVTRDYFVGKLVEDLIVIQSFPPQLRWFVQDSGDERLLTEAVFNVFDEPTKAEQHETDFISACIQTAGSVDGNSI